MLNASKKDNKLPIGVKLIIGWFVLIVILYSIFSFFDSLSGLNLISIMIIVMIGLIYGLSKSLNIARIGTIIYSCFVIGLDLFNISRGVSDFNASFVFRFLVYGVIITYLSLPETKKIFK